MRAGCDARLANVSPARVFLHAVSRAALCGLAGGVVAAGLDVALHWSGAAALEARGAGALVVLGLYGAAVAVSTALVAACLDLLARVSDLGPLARAFVSGERPRRATAGAACAIGVYAGGGFFAVLRTILGSKTPEFFARTAALELLAAALVGLCLGVAVVHRRVPRPRRLLAAGLAAALVGVPAFFWLRSAAMVALGRFHHKGLIAALVTAEGLAVLVALGLAALALERLFARVLGLPPRPAPEGPVRLRALAPAALVVALGAGAAAASSFATLRLLDLRPVLAAGLALAATLVFFARLGRVPRALGLLSPLVALALALALGRSEPPRKAAFALGALSAPIAALVRGAIDLDRDGHSAVLGGGDCSDRDPAIHPGAPDWPDDGIDQDCSGADATVRLPDSPPPPPLPPAVPRGPNVLLITIDTLRADHLGAYGYARPTSPALDRLAADGALFEQGWAHAPSTRYSMPAILVGRHPTEVRWGSRCPYTGGCWDPWPPPLAQDNVTLAERLKALGYRTAALLNYRFFEPQGGYAQGFDVYDNENSALHRADPQKGDPVSYGSSSRQQADKAIAFLGAHASERFFLWVHFYDVHWVYERHPEVPSFGDTDLDLYDGEIRYTDLHVGRVLDRLRELGLYDRTVVAVTGDHGEGFGEHGVRFHGYHLYGPQTRVPYLVRIPGVPPVRVPEAVGHVDLVSTILHAVGAPHDATLPGRSLVPLMTGAREPGRTVFQEVLYEGPVTRLAAVAEGHHLVWNQTPDATYELYDLGADPGETRDVAAAPAEAARKERMTRALGAFWDRQSWGDDFQTRVAPKVSAAEPPVATRLDDRLGEVATLVGVTAPARTRPGELVPIEWVFQAGQRNRGDYRVFVHLEGPGVFVNGDHDPLDGRLPTSRWPAGRFVRDAHLVRIPANARGTLTVFVGLHRGDERVRPSGPHADKDRVRAVTLEVAP